MINLELPGSLKLLSETIHKDIDAHCVRKYSDGHRGHLGASVIGKSCSRALWFAFRWVYYHEFDGRMYRLFQRGHFEEARFTGYLEGIGCEVTVFDKVLLFHPESDSYFYGNLEENSDPLLEVVEDNPAHEIEAEKRGIYMDKGKRQIRIGACRGHFGGSIDAKIKLPARYGIEQDVLFLGEYKTQGSQKFGKLVEKGVQLDKYQHFCQQSIYGLKLGLKYAIYMSVNKNTDDLYIEVIELDWTLGRELEEKAERIIFAAEPPPKIAASATFFECKWCDFNATCWLNKPAEKNCRSCVRCVPVDDAQWFCNLHGANVPKDFIKQGCEEWVTIL